MREWGSGSGQGRRVDFRNRSHLGQVLEARMKGNQKSETLSFVPRLYSSWLPVWAWEFALCFFAYFSALWAWNSLPSLSTRFWLPITSPMSPTTTVRPSMSHMEPSLPNPFRLLNTVWLVLKPSMDSSQLLYQTISSLRAGARARGSLQNIRLIPSALMFSYFVSFGGERGSSSRIGSSQGAWNHRCSSPRRVHF